MAEELLLCPGCARHPQGSSGLCDTCYSNRVLERYLEADGERIEARRERWKGWTDTTDHLRERQRRHRLLTRTKPKEFAHSNSDPLEIAFECLEQLGTVRQALKSNVRAREHLDQAEELVKRLGWGPS